MADLDNEVLMVPQVMTDDSSTIIAACRREHVFDVLMAYYTSAIKVFGRVDKRWMEDDRGVWIGWAIENMEADRAHRMRVWLRAASSLALTAACERP
jgi:hypothetical protein